MIIKGFGGHLQENITEDLDYFVTSEYMVNNNIEECWSKKHSIAKKINNKNGNIKFISYEYIFEICKIKGLKTL